jgi:hypothetical protein
MSDPTEVVDDQPYRNRPDQQLICEPVSLSVVRRNWCAELPIAVTTAMGSPFPTVAGGVHLRPEERLVHTKLLTVNSTV